MGIEWYGFIIPIYYKHYLMILARGDNKGLSASHVDQMRGLMIVGFASSEINLLIRDESKGFPTFQIRQEEDIPSSESAFFLVNVKKHFKREHTFQTPADKHVDTNVTSSGSCWML